MKKNEILFNIKQVLILQIIYWLIFIITFELISNIISDDVVYISGFGGLIIYFIYYFYKKNKIIKKNKFSEKKYIISYIVSWIIIGIILGIIILCLREIELIGACPKTNDCFLYGLEYVFFIVLMEAKIALIAVIEILRTIANKIIKSR